MGFLSFAGFPPLSSAFWGVFYVFFFFIPFCYPRTTLAFRAGSDSDPGSHSGPSPPLPTYGTCLLFYGDNNSAFSSLADSRRNMSDGG